MNTSGQTVLEYVLLIGIITLALVFMSTDFKRGIQSVVKVTADQVGIQANADQDFTGDHSGILTNSYTSSWQNQQRALAQVNNIITPKIGEFTETVTSSYTNVSGQN